MCLEELLRSILLQTLIGLFSEVHEGLIVIRPVKLILQHMVRALTGMLTVFHGVTAMKPVHFYCKPPVVRCSTHINISSYY